MYSTYKSVKLLYCGADCYNATKRGDGNPKWRGGSHYSKGYVYQYAPWHPNATKDGYVREHRLVVEAAIGRLLKKTEVVHHKNGVKDDNRIENLEVCVSTGKHSAEHHIERDKFGRIFTNKPYRNGRAKLTDAQITEIKVARANGETLMAIAERYGVVFSTIYHHTMSEGPNLPSKS